MPIRLRSVPFLALLVLATPANPVWANSFTSRTMIAYTPLQLWDAETVKRLGVRQGAIYMIGEARPFGDVLKLETAYDARRATLSPQADRVAFIGRVGVDAYHSTDGAFVADTSGKVVASFPGVVDYRWSPDGRFLALMYSRGDSGQTGRSGGLDLWSREGAPPRNVSVWPEEIGWTSESRLLVRAGAQVMEIDAHAGSVHKSTHRGVNLSLDLGFSLRPTGNWKRPAVLADRLGLDVTPCATSGFPRPEAVWRRREFHEHLNPDPDLYLSYWVRLPGGDHLLCATGCGGASVPGTPVPRTCTTSIVDVETGERVASFQGYVLGPTVDGLGAVLLRPDDSIGIADVFSATQAYRDKATIARQSRGKPSANVVVDLFHVRTLGKMRERTRVRSERFSVRQGDLLPSMIPVSGCDRPFRVVEVVGSGRVRILYDGEIWKRLQSGGRPISDFLLNYAEGIVMTEGLLLVPRAAGRRTPYSDGGSTPWEVVIRTDPAP